MRTIKFRAWSKSLGMSRPLSLVDIVGSHTDFEEYDTYMQFTGLTDKNGKEIYEGDVVTVFCTENWCDCDDWGDCEEECVDPMEHGNEHKHESPSDCDKYIDTQEVKWGEYGYFTDEEVGEYRVGLGYEYIKLEVIGNIYEHPDLLK